MQTMLVLPFAGKIERGLTGVMVGADLSQLGKVDLVSRGRGKGKTAARRQMEEEQKQSQPGHDKPPEPT